MQELSDEELVARSRAETRSSDADAWINELFQRYHSRVAVWCLRFTGDREQAGDLAQDIFLKAYRNLQSFRGDSKFSTWLYSITRNHCFNENKVRASRPEESLDAITQQFADGATENVLASLQKEESLESVRALMRDALDETERKVMVLHFVQEMTLDTITKLLDLSNTSGAKAYLVSAKRKLAIAVKRLKASQEGDAR